MRNNKEPSSPVYHKANSFVAFENYSGDTLVEKKVIDVIRLDLDQQAPERRAILERAIADLAKPDPAAAETCFRLLPHVREELRRIPDASIADYIHYRYRYDIFPVTREIDKYPPLVQIEPSSSCNYRCVFCYQTDAHLTERSGGHMGRMSLELFQSIVDEIDGHVEAVTLASRGEPTINRHLAEMLEYTKGKFLGLKINTNASLLTDKLCHAILDSGVNTLVYSADAAEERLYSQLRVNGNLEKVLTNVRRFEEIRKADYPNSSIITRVSGVKVREEQGMKDMEDTWGDLVDQVAFVTYNPWENTYEREVNDLTTPCSDLWRRMFVWWDGRCNPCDVDYLTRLETGKMGDRSLSDSWTGEEYERLRTRHQKEKRSELEPCRRCTVV